MDFIPEEHTLLMVVQGTVLPIPAPSAACLAGAWPRLAEQTFPKNTSPTFAASTLAFFSAPSMAMLPSWVAERDDNPPPKLPRGVLTADTIYTLFICCSLQLENIMLRFCYRIFCKYGIYLNFYPKTNQTIFCKLVFLYRCKAQYPALMAEKMHFNLYL
jgi:hypothetical protein